MPQTTVNRFVANETDQIVQYSSYSSLSLVQSAEDVHLRRIAFFKSRFNSASQPFLLYDCIGIMPYAYIATRYSSII